MAMINPYQTSYDPYDEDRDLMPRARSREEYEYLKRRKMQEEMYRMQSMMSPPPVLMSEPPSKPSHMNQKLLLTKGA